MGSPGNSRNDQEFKRIQRNAHEFQEFQVLVGIPIRDAIGSGTGFLPAVPAATSGNERILAIPVESCWSLRNPCDCCGIPMIPKTSYDSLGIFMHSLEFSGFLRRLPVSYLLEFPGRLTTCS